MQTDPIRDLGAAVVKQALDDYCRAAKELSKKNIHWMTRAQAEADMEECKKFLHCKTAIAKHWFHCAQLRPFRTSELRDYDVENHFGKHTWAGCSC